MVYKALLIGHLLGDFYFQSDKLAKSKTKEKKGIALHGAIYFCSLLPVLLFFSATASVADACAWAAAASVIHCAVDWLKVKLEKNIKNAERCKAMIFLSDQLIHILILGLLTNIYNITADTNTVNRFLELKEWDRYITLALSGLICWKPASICISIVFKSIPNIISESESHSCPRISDYGQECCPYNKLEEESIKAGAWIGILEREIILILGVLNQFGAIGFVLAAKSMARFKQLENKAFAEKYLVGTLLSALISFACVVLTTAALHS